MDPPVSLVNECSYSNGNAGSYNLSEIWQFPMSAGMEDSGGLRRPSFGQFGDVSGAIRDVLGGGDPNQMSLEQRTRKRRDAEDESSPKSSGNIGAVINFQSHFFALCTCCSLLA